MLCVCDLLLQVPIRITWEGFQNDWWSTASKNNYLACLGPTLLLRNWTKWILKMCLNIWNYQEGKNLEGQDSDEKEIQESWSDIWGNFFPQEDWLPVSKSVPDRLKS